MDLGAVIINRFLAEEGDFFLGQKLNLLAGTPQLLEGVLATEVLANEKFEALLDFALFGDRNAATDARSADQDHEC